MIYRLFPSKDTFITNFKKFGTPQTASNNGASEIIHLFSVANVSTSSGLSSGSSGRILTSFDLSSISELTSSGIPSNNIRYRLRMNDARHHKTLPESYDVEVFTLSSSWDEGKGRDPDAFADKGFANWDKRKSNAFWTTPGGDVTGTPSVQHFDSGEENLDIDVTRHVNSWLTGGLPNNGFIVKMSSTLDPGSIDYYVKMFHARNTHFPDKTPHLEASWDDSILDDRNNFVFDNTGSLYLYNVVRGQLTNIQGIGTGQNVITVRITDSSGTIKVVSGSHTGMTGIYSASFVITTGSYSGSIFHDIWHFGSKSFMTCSFIPTEDFSNCVIDSTQYHVTMKNLNSWYTTTDKPRFKLFIKNKDYNPAVVLTASFGPSGLVITKSWYQVINDSTSEIVIPFETGSNATRLSYDEDGNYFDFYMSNLPKNEVYRFAFLFDVNGNKQIIDKGFKFKVY